MTTSAEDRIHSRYAVVIPLVWIHGEVEHEATTINMSLGGMFVRGREAPPFYSVIKVRFRIPALRQETTVDAHVRWVEPVGFGIQFMGMRAIEVWGLNQLFRGFQSGGVTTLDER